MACHDRPMRRASLTNSWSPPCAMEDSAIHSPGTRSRREASAPRIAPAVPFRSARCRWPEKPTTWNSGSRPTAPVAAAGCGSGNSDIEAEVHDVAFLHDILLAFEAEPAGFPRACLPLVGAVVIVRGRLGADAAALEVRVDDAGGLRRGRPGAHGPGAHLLRPRGEEGQEAEQPVSRADDAVEPWLGEAEVGEEGRAVALLELGDLRLDRGADRDDDRALGGGELLERRE